MAISQEMWRRERERKRRERQRQLQRQRTCAVVVLIAAIAAVAIILANAGKNNTETDSGETAAVSTSATSSNGYTQGAAYTSEHTEGDLSMSFFKNSVFAGNALAETVKMYGVVKEIECFAGVNIDAENVYNVTAGAGTISVADQFKSKKFDKIFLSFGENELSWESSSKFKAYYRDFVEKIKEYQPRASVYLIAIPPVTEEISTSGGYVTMENIKAYNKRIKSIAISEETYYIDSVDALADDDGYLPEGVSCDGINLNKSAVIDLLYYASKEAYIPKSSDMVDNEDEDDEDSDSDTTKKTEEPKKAEETASPSPEPTVNVLKSSAKEKKQGD